MISHRRLIFAAALILLVAVILRLSALSIIPPGLHYDEAANGVIVRNIAFGGYWPIFIPEYTGKEVLWFYSAALMMQILGPVIFALRLTSAFFGVVTVATTGWLVRQLYQDDTRRDYLALLSMAILAIAFWHGILSRFADRAITQPLLQALSLGFLWCGLRSTRRRDQVGWLALAGAVTGLAAYTYLAVRLFPLVLAIVLTVFLLTDNRRIDRIPGLLAYPGMALLVFAPLGWYFIQHPEAFGTRIQQVAPASQEEVVRGWYLATRMFFVSGDPLMRFNLPGKPMFGSVLAIFFVLGLLVAWRDAFRVRGALSPTRGILLIIWPIVMLAPTALAVGGHPPSNLRAVGLAPLIALYPALGIMEMSRILYAHDHLRQWGRLAAPGCLALLLMSGTLTLRDLLRWGYGTAPDYPLYYDNDGHVASLARFLNDEAPDATVTYLATYHFRHPTLTFLAPGSAEVRSLFGGDALVLAASGDTLLAYSRDALPPVEWQDWLSDHLIAAPHGPDGTPDFYAYLLPKQIDAGLQPVSQANFGNIIELEGIRFLPARSGETASVDAAWRILAPAPQPDYAFVAEVCDAYGWCWVKANLDGSLERGQNNAYNSTQWSPGEWLLTRIEVPLPDGMPPGQYSVRINIFSAQANNRLPLIDSANGFAGFYAEVPGLRIAASTEPDLTNLPMQVQLFETIRPYVTLLGYDLPTQEARPGERIHLALHWLSEGHQPGDVNVIIRLGDDSVLYEGAPVQGTHPLTEWQPNELITDRYHLRLPADLPAGIYPLVVQLGDSIPIELGVLTIQETNRLFDVPPMTGLNEPVVFGGQIMLMGYNVPNKLTPGHPVDVMLVWRAETEVAIGYTVFIHLVDPSGNIITQDDRPPFLAGQPYPTDLWLPGEIVPDVHTLNVPGGLPSGEYQIRLGLYLQDNGQRLSAPGTADNALILPITLIAP